MASQASRPSAFVTDGCVMTDESTHQGRGISDRRGRPTSPMDALRSGGRRCRPRREHERQGVYFVDRFYVVTLALIVALLGLTVVDGVLTIELIRLNSEEANPLMAHFLRQGDLPFLMVKYIMTAVGLPFLVVYQHYPLLRTRFRVGWLLPIFVALYLVLLFHQWSLIQIGHPDTTGRMPPMERIRPYRTGPVMSADSWPSRGPTPGP
jgi:hypothetical protein